MKRIFIVGLLIATQSIAGLMPTKSDYYYKLGGDSDVFIPPINHDHRVVIGGDINADLGLMNCSLYNPAISVSNTLNNLKDSVSGMPEGVISNLKGSIA